MELGCQEETTGRLLGSSTSRPLTITTTRMPTVPTSRVDPNALVPDHAQNEAEDPLAERSYLPCTHRTPIKHDDKVVRPDIDTDWTDLDIENVRSMRFAYDESTCF